MANLVIATALTTHAAPVNTRNALVAKGHTVTIIADSAVGSHDFTGVDAVLVLRNTVSSALASALAALDLPLVLSLVETSTAGVVTNSVASYLNLCRRINLLPNTVGLHSVVNAHADHPIVSGAFGAQTQITTGANFWGTLEDRHLFVGDLIATGGTQHATAVVRPETFAVEAGTLDLNGDPVPNRVVVTGSMYGGQTAYTAAGEDWLDRIAAWATAAPESPARPDSHTLYLGDTPAGPPPSGVIQPFISASGNLAVGENAGSFSAKMLEAEPLAGFRNPVWVSDATAKAVTAPTQEILLRCHTPDGDSGFIGPMVRAFGGPGRENGVSLIYRRNDSILQLNRLVNGAFSDSFTGTTTSAFLSLPEGPLWLRLRVEGTTYRGRAWAEGTPEPTSWQVVGTSTAPAQFGWPGAYMTNPTRVAEIDYWVSASDDATIPVPPEISIPPARRHDLDVVVPDVGQEESRLVAMRNDGTVEFDSGWSADPGVVTGLSESTEYWVHATARVGGTPRPLVPFPVTTAARWASTFSEFEPGYQLEFGEWDEILVAPNYSTWIVRELDGASDDRILERQPEVTGAGARDPLFNVTVSQRARDQRAATAVRYATGASGSTADNSIAGLALRIAGDPGGEGGEYYALVLRSSNRVSIVRGSRTAVDILATVMFPHAAETFYELRFEAEGAALRGKVWLRGDDEPEGWTITAANGDLPRGTPGIYAGGQSRVDFDRLTIGIEAEESSNAPPPPPIIVDPAFDGEGVRADHLVRWTQPADPELDALTHSGRLREVGAEEWTPWFADQPDGVLQRALPGLTAGVLYELEIWANDGEFDGDPATRILSILDAPWFPCEPGGGVDWSGCGPAPDGSWAPDSPAPGTPWEEC